MPRKSKLPAHGADGLNDRKGILTNQPRIGIIPLNCDGSCCIAMDRIVSRWIVLYQEVKDSMVTLPPHHVDALNALLAEQRASVECEIAFASGAGEYQVREAFTTMGREDVEICDALHQGLAAAEAPVTFEVSPAGEGILALELYDDRLRAFAQHQRAVSARAGELVGELPEGELRRTVQRLGEMHAWHALWAEQLAADFAATRLWENGRRPRQGQVAAAGRASGDAPVVSTGILNPMDDSAPRDALGGPPGSDGASRSPQSHGPGGSGNELDEA